MCEITRYLLDEEVKKTCELNREIKELYRTARNIIDTYVSPEFASRAYDELDNWFIKNNQD